MKLIRELLEGRFKEVKRSKDDKPEVAPRNFVVKHAQRSGAGAHDLKGGKKAKRAKQKQQFKKQMKDLDY
jgi:hypothetical protein